MTDPAASKSSAGSENVRLEFSDFSTSALPPIRGVDDTEMTSTTRGSGGADLNDLLLVRMHSFRCFL